MSLQLLPNRVHKQAQSCCPNRCAPGLANGFRLFKPVNLLVEAGASVLPKQNGVMI